jgi:transglutaminase-like putative cysteine protease
MWQDNWEDDADIERDEPLALEGTWVYRLVTSLLLFGLLLEWLLPWTGAGQWALLHDPWPLVAVIGGLLMVGLFDLPVLAKGCANVLLSFLCLTWLHKGEAQSMMEWIAGFPSLLMENIRQLLDHGLWAMGGELQTLLLLIGWAMLVPALQALLWLRHTALGMLALTLAYLVTLHVWLGMDVMTALLRSTAEGLLLASITALPRAKARLGAGWLAAGWDRIQHLDKRWLAGAMFLTITIVGCGLLVSAGRDTSQEPASWTREVGSRMTRTISAWGGEHAAPVAVRSTKASSLGGALTGYGFDDSRLGLPIEENDEPLFIGFSPIMAYWRGEAKTVYDGSGWSNISGALSLHPVNNEAGKANAGPPGTAGEASGEGASDDVNGDDYAREGAIYESGDSSMRDRELNSSGDDYGGGREGSAGNLDSVRDEANNSNGDDPRRYGAQGATVVQTVVWNRPAAFMPLFASGLGAEASELIGADPRRTLGSFLRNEDIDVIYAGTEGAKVERYTVVSRLPFADSEQLGRIEEALAEQMGKSASAGSFGEKNLSASTVGNGGQKGERVQVKAAPAQADESKLDAAELERYLQLPDTLPKRVEALAAEVAGGGLTSQYERVKAVEHFLETSYPYTKTDSELPPSGSDFVDHFLFEQKSGYCVHFSSAMVVMLRSQGIPARWVKGFTPGNVLEGSSLRQAASETASADGGMTAYQVRGSDAHAWVEVYFDGAGWVPFDPTPGMSGAGATTAAAALPGGAAALAAGGPIAAGWGEMSLAHLADWLGAAAKPAAEVVARAAGVLAKEARSAVAAAAAAPAAAAVAAGMAALALGAAGALIAQRKQLRLRLRLALALRRYGAAYARYSAAPGLKPAFAASSYDAGEKSRTTDSGYDAGDNSRIVASVSGLSDKSGTIANVPGLVDKAATIASLSDLRDKTGFIASVFVTSITCADGAPRLFADIHASEEGIPSRLSSKRKSRFQPASRAQKTLQIAKADVSAGGEKSTKSAHAGKVVEVGKAGEAGGASKAGQTDRAGKTGKIGKTGTTRTGRTGRTGRSTAAVERVRICMVEVTSAVLALLEGAGGDCDMTFRQRTNALETRVAEADRRLELRRLSLWGETAAFGKPGQTFAAPSPQELKQA